MAAREGGFEKCNVQIVFLSIPKVGFLLHPAEESGSMFEAGEGIWLLIKLIQGTSKKAAVRLMSVWQFSVYALAGSKGSNHTWFALPGRGIGDERRSCKKGGGRTRIFTKGQAGLTTARSSFVSPAVYGHRTRQSQYDGISSPE